MPKYFAQLDNQGNVIQVIVADSSEWCVENLGGQWVETFMDREDKNYASAGHKYHSDKDNFSGISLEEDFVLNEKLQWEPVKGMPETLEGMAWSKESKDFVPIEEVKAELAVKTIPK